MTRTTTATITTFYYFLRVQL